MFLFQFLTWIFQVYLYYFYLSLAISYSAFDELDITPIHGAQSVVCSDKSSSACIHGTFITGILGAKRGVNAPSICPVCKFVVRPVFHENLDMARTNIEELYDAIIETVDKGAMIINLSLGTPSSSMRSKLQEAYAYASERGVIIIVAAGNQGYIGSNSMLGNDWVIPVSACNQLGIPLRKTNLGILVSKYGTLAPGYNIRSTFPNGKYGYMEGSSVAAAIVSGAIALLSTAAI